MLIDLLYDGRDCIPFCKGRNERKGTTRPCISFWVDAASVSDHCMDPPFKWWTTDNALKKSYIVLQKESLVKMQTQLTTLDAVVAADKKVLGAPPAATWLIFAHFPPVHYMRIHPLF